VTCPTCGAENPGGFRFCGSCGAALTVEQAPERRERKVVTVLFADLVGFTSQAERLDPEDVRAILDGYHARLRSELEHYGGTVEKFIGDAVMALFGAPVAHEDDPERAVRAALAIRDALAEARADGGSDLHARIGITTGEALVHLGARPESGEGMAAGDVVNTAARLQSAAPVDGIVVDEPTYRATERRIAYDTADPVEAKGKSEPIPVWTVTGPRSSFGADVAESARTDLFGREREVAVLREALARVRRDGVPQLVTLVGVPGIGKSRLVYELSRIVDEDPDLIVWRQGRCLPYGEGGSFRALGDIVKAQAGILETDAGAEAVAKLRHAVAALVSDEAEAAWVERQLAPLAGVAGGQAVGGEQEEAFTAWRRFVEALADGGPAVIVLEDLHWADDALLDFVEHLADWAAGVPLLVVCVARPELLSRRPGWGGGNPNSTTLSLAPLGDDDIARLVASLMERAVMPAEVQAALLARAGGNPLYAEEFVRLVLESDAELVHADALPSSVQAIIAARLDALDAGDKTLVQDAAVLGKVFWRGGVASLSGREPADVERRLHELVRRQIVRPDRRSSVAGETEYAFWHVLVRDVAYGQIPRAQRARKHGLAAAWIESLSSERLEDRADLLAHHYGTSLELARAAGQDTSDLVVPAREALRAAGERSLAVHAFAAAERSLGAALELWPEDDPERPLLLLAYARAAFVSGESGRDELVAARDALVQIGDLEHAAEAETVLAEAAWMAGEPADTLEHVERAATLVAGLSPSRGKAYVLANFSRYLMLAGRSTEAIAIGREALAMAEGLGLDELRAHALNNIGSARHSTGDLGGLADLEESVAIAERIGSPEAIRGYINLAAAYGRDGQFRPSREIHQRGYELAERFGFRTRLRFLAAEIATDDYWLGDWDAAFAASDRFIADVEAGAPHYLEGMIRLTRGAMAFARGSAHYESDLALALEQARQGGEPQSVMPALAVVAQVTADAGDTTRAEALLDELLALAHSGTEGPRAELWIYPALHALEELGRAAEIAPLVEAAPVLAWTEAARRHLAGDLAGAADVLESAGALTDEARARFAAAERFAAAGQQADAQAQLDRALTFYRSVGASLYVQRAERLLPASA
jgi:predicted ATPase/class 3 adenylate cyclase